MPQVGGHVELLMMAAPQDTDAHMKLLVSVVHVSPRHGAFCQECRAIYDQGFALLRDTPAEVGLGQPSQVHLEKAWLRRGNEHMRRNLLKNCHKGRKKAAPKVAPGDRR